MDWDTSRQIMMNMCLNVFAFYFQHLSVITFSKTRVIYVYYNLGGCSKGVKRTEKKMTDLGEGRNFSTYYEQK